LAIASHEARRAEQLQSHRLFGSPAQAQLYGIAQRLGQQSPGVKPEAFQNIAEHGISVDPEAFAKLGPEYPSAEFGTVRCDTIGPGEAGRLEARLREGIGLAEGKALGGREPFEIPA